MFKACSLRLQAPAAARVAKRRTDRARQRGVPLHYYTKRPDMATRVWGENTLASSFVPPRNRIQAASVASASSTTRILLSRWLRSSADSAAASRCAKASRIFSCSSTAWFQRSGEKLAM